LKSDKKKKKDFLESRSEREWRVTLFVLPLQDGRPDMRKDYLLSTIANNQSSIFIDKLHREKHEENVKKKN